MAFIIPNTGDTVSGAKFESLDQAEPDSLDFEILGNIGRSGVLTGCQVSTNGNNSDVQVSAGVVVINGVPYTVTAVSALSLGTLPSHSQFAMVVARLTSGSVSLVLVNGNDDPTNPTYPKTPNTSTSGTINLATDVVLAAIHRDGNKAVTASSIVDKRTILSSSVFSQGTTAPSGGTTGSLYYKNDVAEGATGSGLYIKNASGTWIEAAQLANNNVTDVQLRDSAGLSVIGRSANTTGDPADIVAGTDGHVLRRSGTSLEFGQVATAGVTDNAVDNTKLRDSSALSVIGRSANTTGDPADIVAGTDHHVLRRSGTTLGFGILSGASIDDESIDSRHYVDLSIDTDHLSNNVVSNTKLRDSAAVSVIGRAATTAGDPADIAIGTNRVLGRTTGNLISTQVQTDMIANDAINGDKIADKAVTLGTHTVGNYVAGVTGGSYISVSGTAGEGWTPTITATGLLPTAGGTMSGDVTFSRSGLVSVTLEHKNSTNANRGMIRFGNGINDQDIACADLFAGGNIYYGGAVVPSSSRTIKNSIEDFVGASRIIDDLRPVTYMLNAHPDMGEQVGLVAEEVEEIDPRFVVHGDVLGLNLNSLVGLALAGLREANSRIVELEARIAQLEG